MCAGSFDCENNTIYENRWLIVLQTREPISLTVTTPLSPPLPPLEQVPRRGCCSLSGMPSAHIGVDKGLDWSKSDFCHNEFRFAPLDLHTLFF